MTGRRLKPIIVEVKRAAQRIAGCSVTYQRELVLCGKRGCSKRHGPYWYAYWWKPHGLFESRGRIRKRYIGKQWRSLTAAEVVREPKEKPALCKTRPRSSSVLPKTGRRRGPRP